MKLNYKKIICVGFAFFLISMFWQVYDTVIAKVLIDSFGLKYKLDKTFEPEKSYKKPIKNKTIFRIIH